MNEITFVWRQLKSCEYKAYCRTMNRNKAPYIAYSIRNIVLMPCWRFAYTFICHCSFFNVINEDGCIGIACQPHEVHLATRQRTFDLIYRYILCIPFFIFANIGLFSYIRLRPRSRSQAKVILICNSRVSSVLLNIELPWWPNIPCYHGNRYHGFIISYPDSTST